VIRSSSTSARLLRWYPPSWRARYGEELTALLDDVRDDEGLSFAGAMSLRRAGLAERWSASGLTGTARPPGERLRAGSIAVLCGWALMMVAGASVAKASEHFASVLPATDRTLAQISIDTVTAGGVVGVAIVATGAVGCVPAFVRFLRAGGWRDVARVIAGAVASTVVTASALVGLVIWAQHLDWLQRNGGDPAYTLAFMTVMAMGVITLTMWTVVAVTSVNRIRLDAPTLRLEGACALGLTVAMAMVTAGSITWLAQMALHAPWFIRGTSSGGVATLWLARLVVTVVAMLTAAGVGLLGSVRVVRSWRLVGSNG